MAFILLAVFVVMASGLSLRAAEPPIDVVSPCLQQWCQLAGLSVVVDGCQQLHEAVFTPDTGEHSPVIEAPETSHRLLQLITGEAFPVELLSIDEWAVEMRLANSSFRYRIPREFVAKISRLNGRWDVWSAPLGNAPVRWLTEAETPISAGELELWWTSPVHDSLSLEMQFEGSPPLQWDVAPSLPNRNQSIVVPAGWKVTSRQPAGMSVSRTGPMFFRWTETEWSWVENEVVRMTGRRPAGGLMQIAAAVASSSANTSSGRLFLRRHFAEEPATNRKLAATAMIDPRQDLCVQAEGTQLYGQLIHATGEEVSLRSSLGTIPLAWQDIDEVLLARRSGRGESPLALRGRIVQGIDVQSPGSDIHRWVFAVNPVDGHDGVTHPLLGRFPREQIPVLSSDRFAGEWRWLFPAMAHLKSHERPGIPELLPTEDHLAGEWRQPRAGSAAWSTNQIRFRVEVAGMTPVGRDVSPSPISTKPPLGSVQHQETPLWDVFVNGVSIGCLNHQLRARPRLFAPEVIALEVPRELLHAGINRWEVRRRSDRGGATDDEIWLGRIALEVKSQRSR